MNIIFVIANIIAILQLFLPYNFVYSDWFWDYPVWRLLCRNFVFFNTAIVKYRMISMKNDFVTSGVIRQWRSRLTRY